MVITKSMAQTDTPSESSDTESNESSLFERLKILLRRR